MFYTIRSLYESDELKGIIFLVVLCSSVVTLTLGVWGTLLALLDSDMLTKSELGSEDFPTLSRKDLRCSTRSPRFVPCSIFRC